MSNEPEKNCNATDSPITPVAAENRIYKALTHNLKAQNKMGTSKHEAKLAAREVYLAEHGDLEGWNPAAVEGIFSLNTMTTYREAVKGFSHYSTTQGARRASDLTELMGENYLRSMHEEGQSAWSVATAAAAINKATGWKLSPSKLGLPTRRKEDITRSRLDRYHDNRDFSKYARQITFTKATGIRRMSMLVVCPCDCARDTEGTVIGVQVKEKGGRARLAPVLNAYREEITAIVDKAVAERGVNVPIFDAYDIHIDNHHFRAEYAAALLHQLEEERAAGQPLFGGAFKLEDYCHLKGKDAKRKAKTAGHDTDLIGTVSGALGHNRVEIVLRHYMYLY